MGPYGTTIANGFFNLSLLGKFSREIPLPGSTSEAFLTLNHGLDKVRFIEAVPVGRVRDLVTLEQIEERSNGKLFLTTSDTIELEGESKLAMAAQFLAMLVPR